MHSRLDALTRMRAYSDAFTHMRPSDACKRMQAHATCIRIHAHSTAFDCLCLYLPGLHVEDFQNYRRGLQRGSRPAVVQYKNKVDLLNYMKEHALPATITEMQPKKLYAVDGMASIWDSFPEVTGMVLVSLKSVQWIGQLLQLEFAWALHGDGKHKLHHGRWILCTFGCHSLAWDKNHKCYRHSFRCAHV